MKKVDPTKSMSGSAGETPSCHAGRAGVVTASSLMTINMRTALEESGLKTLMQCAVPPIAGRLGTRDAMDAKSLLP